MRHVTVNWDHWSHKIFKEPTQVIIMRPTQVSDTESTLLIDTDTFIFLPLEALIVSELLWKKISFSPFLGLSNYFLPG